MDELSVEIGKNIRKYRQLKGLTIEQLSEILGTESNYLGQCERGVRRLGLDKLVDLMGYFGITAGDIIPVTVSEKEQLEEKNRCLKEINGLLEQCSVTQLEVVLNMLREITPFIKE